MKNKKKLSVYVHIPFCVRKCLYCDFLSFTCADVDSYMSAMWNQIRGEAVKLADTYVVDTVFIGGGTPSCIPETYIQKTLSVLRESFSFAPGRPEITIEANPGTVTPAKLRAYHEAGINRISIGVQSFVDDELRALGRIHNSKDAATAYQLAREAGFENVSMDLMSGIPGQSGHSLKESLERAAELGPEHISVYSLIIEEGTPYAELYPDGAVDEDTDREMYEMTKEFLAKHGYRRYEISNYARTGRECRHNCAYWTMQDYIGFGIGAASMIGNRRFKVIDDLQEYVRLLKDKDERSDRLGVCDREHVCGGERVCDIEHVCGDGNDYNGGSVYDQLQECTNSPSEMLSEAIFLGLRMSLGVDLRKLEKTYGIDVAIKYADVIEHHTKNGLLLIEDGQMRLSDKGMDLANYVMSDFV